MHVRTNRRILAHHADHGVRGVRRVRGCEPNPLDPIHLRDCGEEVGEVVVAVVVGVHGLAEQRDLSHPALCESARLADKRRQGDALLSTSNKRHDAERAELVAPSLDRQPRLDALRAGREDVGVILGAVQSDVEERLVADALERVGQVPVRVRAHHEINVRGAIQQAVRDALRHAAADAQHQFRLQRLSTR